MLYNQVCSFNWVLKYLSIATANHDVIFLSGLDILTRKPYHKAGKTASRSQLKLHHLYWKREAGLKYLLYIRTYRVIIKQFTSKMYFGGRERSKALYFVVL